MKTALCLNWERPLDDNTQTNTPSSNCKKVFAKIYNELAKNKISAANLEKELFPHIKADVFLSHSHTDKKIALEIQNKLYTNKKINVFTDFSVWEDVQDIFNELCPKSRNPREIYTITTQLNAILSMALTKMLSDTPILIFLNTTNANSDLKNKTYSPWIYQEILMSNLMLSQYNFSTESFTEEKKVVVEYDLSMNNFNRISTHSFDLWMNKKSDSKENSILELQNYLK